MEFTKSQKLAIELRNRNILVSAAAGSGKTATLTERILRLLTDESNPIDINSMLIVTFTRAAAGELRTRISKKLSEALANDPSNRHIAHQITSLPSAKICTIDSYYLDLVRNNFQKLGIPARFRLADETELQILRSEVMNAVIERRYESDPDFCAYADEITTARSENQLADLLLSLYYKSLTVQEGTGIIEKTAKTYLEYQNKDFFSTSLGKILHYELCELVKYLIKKANRLVSLISEDPGASAYGNALAADIDFLNTFSEELSKFSYIDARKIVFDYSPVPLGRISKKNQSEITEEIKVERGEIKEKILKLREKEFVTHPDDIQYICQKSAQLCLKTKEVLDDFISAYQTEKSSRAICEFSDLRQYALKLLIDENGIPTAIAKDEQKKYSHIFVDEYQDTDNIQDLVFKTISNGTNLFFVGDIKQSIYSFRGANPSVFSSYRKTYHTAQGREHIPEIPLSVFMSENFRCSPNIIEFTNTVCSYLFRETEGEYGGIGYVAEDDLISARQDPVCQDKVRVVLLEENNDNDDNVNIEAEFVISEIKSMLKGKAKPDGTPYQPCDIAILTRSNKEAANIANALARAGIPHANSTGDDLFENPEVLLMLSMLSVSDNPHRDIPLAAVLRSPIFGFTFDDIVKMRMGRYSMSLFDAMENYSVSIEADPILRDKCISAVSTILNYRTEAESMPVHTFMRFLWKDTCALSFAGSDIESKKRTAIERRRNLRRFYDYARKYEASSYKGLHDFVEYINSIISQKTKIAEEDAVTDNTVRIMTVHKSKGLEFPAVFLIGCSKKTNSADSRSNIIFEPSEDISLAFKVSDSTGFGLLDSIFRVSLANKALCLSSEEEIRVLYVALTRARDNLCIVASGKNNHSFNLLNDAFRKSSLGGRVSVLDSSSWLERILLGLAANQLNQSYLIETPVVSCHTENSNNYDIDYIPNEDEISRLCDLIRPSLEFKYRFTESSDIPAKVSVSSLYPELLNDTDDSYDIIKKVESMESRRPRFMGGGDDSAEKGTATHLFMQFCDFSNLTPDHISVKNEIARLTNEKYLPQNVSDLIRVNEIVKFISSDFFRLIKGARRIHRELRFNVFLPASEFTDISVRKELFKDEQILVQGVIDLCMEDSNGNLILCDYKTDRLSKEALGNREIAKDFLFKRHSLQLKYYAQAIEQIMGKKPDKIYIYSLPFGDAIKMDI